MEFSYENQGHLTFLTYEIAPDDVVDTMSLGMITNNKIHGLAPTIFTQMDMSRYLKYNVSAKISALQFFSGTVRRNNLLGVFKGILSAMIASEDYMIENNSLLLDLNYIFVEVSTCEVSMICLPIMNKLPDQTNLNGFFKNILFSTQTDPSENCDYVAKILNHLNSSALFSLEEFRDFLDSLSAGASPAASTPAPAAEKAQPVQTPAAEVQMTQNRQPTVSNTPAVNTQPAAAQPMVNRPAVEQPRIPTPAGNTVIPPVNKTAPVNKAEPEPSNDAAKKKGGLFGLFSSKDKKEPKEEKKTVQQPANAIPTNFAIPGQKPAVQNTAGSFAIPGQNVPVKPGTPAPQNEKKPAPVQKAPERPIQQNPQIPVQQNPVPSQPMSFGETTVLGGGGGKIGETTVLGAVSSEVQVRPHLIRIKNNERINLDKPVFRIGKEKSYVDYFVGDNAAISRSHCNIVSRDGQYFIVDTNSTNHTYVNGGMIQSNVETSISHGTKIRLANEDFEFKLY